MERSTATRTLSIGDGINVWLGDVPEAEYLVGETLARVMRVAPSEPARPPRRVTAMMQKHTCRPIYSYLGGSFGPTSSATLRIEAAVSDVPGRRVTWTHWPHPGNARAGLPREFAEAIVPAAAEESIVARLGGGTLRFDRAVLHDVGSVQMAYTILSRVIVRLLAADTDQALDEELGVLALGAVMRATRRSRLDD